MRAAVFQEDRLLINDDQQQLPSLHLKGSAIAILQIDQTLQRNEHAPSGIDAALHL